MNATRFRTTVDEALARAAPELRPLLGKPVELIALDLDEDREPAPGRKLGLDELISLRLAPPPGVGSQSVDDIDRAIAKGATGGDA